MRKTTRDRTTTFVLAVVFALLTSALTVHWVRGFLKTVRPSPPSEFSPWLQTRLGLRFVGDAVMHLREAGCEERSFAELVFALTNDAILSGVLTNGAFPEARNPFPGVLPPGDYSRTIELPAGFSPTNVPLLWRAMRHGEEMVQYLPWSGGDAVAVTAADFQRLLDGLAHHGFPTNLVKDWKRESGVVK